MAKMRSDIMEAAMDLCKARGVDPQAPEYSSSTTGANYALTAYNEIVTFMVMYGACSKAGLIDKAPVFEKEIKGKCQMRFYPRTSPLNSVQNPAADFKGATKARISWGTASASLTFNHPADEVMSFPELLEHVIIPLLQAHSYPDTLIERYINVDEIHGNNHSSHKKPVRPSTYRIDLNVPQRVEVPFGSRFLKAEIEDGSAYIQLQVPVQQSPLQSVCFYAISVARDWDKSSLNKLCEVKKAAHVYEIWYAGSAIIK